MKLHTGLRIAVAALILAGPVTTLTGCQKKEGPAEKAGKAVDDTVDDVKDAID